MSLDGSVRTAIADEQTGADLRFRHSTSSFRRFGKLEQLFAPSGEDGPIGPGSYRPAELACSRTTSPAGSAGARSQAIPDSALAACTHSTVRSRFISAIRCTNSK